MPQEILCRCASPFLAGAVRSFFNTDTGESRIEQMCMLCFHFRRTENFPLTASPRREYTLREADTAHTMKLLSERKRVFIK